MEADHTQPQSGRVDVPDGAELVDRMVRSIDACGVPESDVLLTDLLCAAWPTPRAQSQ
jgi:hypothetical protein